MIKKNVTKFVAAVALTIAIVTSSGVVAEQIGLDAVDSVYAGNGCGSSSGGGC